MNPELVLWPSATVSAMELLADGALMLAFFALVPGLAAWATWAREHCPSVPHREEASIR